MKSLIIHYIKEAGLPITEVKDLTSDLYQDLNFTLSINDYLFYFYIYETLDYKRIEINSEIQNFYRSIVKPSPSVFQHITNAVLTQLDILNKISEFLDNTLPVEKYDLNLRTLSVKFEYKNEEFETTVFVSEKIQLKALINGMYQKITNWEEFYTKYLNGEFPLRPNFLQPHPVEEYLINSREE